MKEEKQKPHHESGGGGENGGGLFLKKICGWKKNQVREVGSNIYNSLSPPHVEVSGMSLSDCQPFNCFVYSLQSVCLVKGKD